MDMDLLQRLIRSRLPVYLIDPADIAAFKMLQGGRLVTGSTVDDGGGSQVEVTSVTAYGRAFIAIRESAHGKLPNQGRMFEDSK